MTEPDFSDTAEASSLLHMGCKSLALKEYAAAVEALGRALELLVSEHGDFSDRCAETYFWYGKALIGLWREESNVLAGDVDGDAQEDSDDSLEEDGNNEISVEAVEPGTLVSEIKENNEPVNPNAKESEHKVEQTKLETVQSDAAMKDNNESVNQNAMESEHKVKQTQLEIVQSEAAIKLNDEKTMQIEDKPSTSNGDSAANDKEEEDKDDVNNLQLAWEILDISRQIFSKRLVTASNEANQLLLADAYHALGEVALESETFDKAVSEFEKSLQILASICEPQDRKIIELNYQLGLAHSLSSNYDQSARYYNGAASLLESRIDRLERNNPSVDDLNEIKELKELLPDMREKIKETADFKAEVQENVREVLCKKINGSPTTTTAASRPTDISHLVKRKRPSADDSAEASASKKPTI